MINTKLLLAVAGLVLLADLCHSATIRDSIGRQINFPDSENPETEGVQPQSQGFIQRIFNMIKNLLGFESTTRTTVMRSDGTIEEVEVPNGGGGFLSRITNRLMGFINSILSVLTGDDGTPRLGGYRKTTSTAANEIERELMKMASQRS